MKHLTLIRHAKSNWDDTGLSDFDRPLNKRGERDAPRMGRELERMIQSGNQLPRPDRLVASPARRAWTTAILIAREIHYPEDQILKEPRIYEASTLTLFCLMREWDAALGHVLMVGHNPGLESLARKLDPRFRGDGHKFPTCGVSLLTLRADTWADLAEGSAVESLFLCPKMNEG